jgi:amicyanin
MSYTHVCYEKSHAQSSLRDRFQTILMRLRVEAVGVALAASLTVPATIRSSDSADDGTRASKSASAEVQIDNFSFSPKIITVPAGTTVVWTNHDDVPHVVASGDDKFAKSPVIDTDQTFSHTFTSAGSYTYFCTIHPHMTGKVIVE